MPCDREILLGNESPLRRPLVRGRFKVCNSIAVQPMEGWDGTADGNPSESTIRRWRRFGRSGAGLIWGGEAVAVSHEARANPNQLVIAPHTEQGLARLRGALMHEHRTLLGTSEPPLIGLQFTHVGLTPDSPLLSDSEIEGIIADFHRAAVVAWRLGFDFVDIKHCHGYLGHEFLSAHSRPGRYGGSFENRTRFLREIVQGIRLLAPGLEIGVRLSAFDTVPFRPDPSQTSGGQRGIPETRADLSPYEWGFGVNTQNPVEMDLSETSRFVSLLQKLNIVLVNITAGSPYYNPHIQRPALYPPSDGYHPPEDPIVGVARQMEATRQLKRQFPDMLFVGSAYTYLQEFLPLVAQAAVREGWVDVVGLGRMVLTYPEILWDASEGRSLQRKRICRTFSDCTTAPRKGLPSGCYPLDSYYKESDLAKQLEIAKGIAPPKPGSVNPFLH
ncbi:MAG: NADH:flavin oxidoreductase [Acidobacteria bacterium]|nr:MAG: NADH:flavin oxidoreductase [Acidobacteriota bacterium]